MTLRPKEVEMKQDIAKLVTMMMMIHFDDDMLMMMSITRMIKQQNLTQLKENIIF
jgi:hypothetical protein